MFENIQDAEVNLKYLEDTNFDKYLSKLEKKLSGKSVVIYGAGVLFQLINARNDLSKLNIIGISDMRFENHKEGEEFLGYKVVAPDEIPNVEPDYVLIATKKYLTIAENLYNKHLKNTSTKLKPLVKRNFREIFKEIWDN